MDRGKWSGCFGRVSVDNHRLLLHGGSKLHTAVHLMPVFPLHDNWILHGLVKSTDADADADIRGEVRRRMLILHWQESLSVVEETLKVS